MLDFLESWGILLKAELLLRILLSVICGYLIGNERTHQGKQAGVKTHSIVALASCLMMLISQYGFEDFYSMVNYPEVGMRLDPSRVAAQIISGIGFLGAGMIYVHKNNITGLTTAAGIWATAGIGMAIGGGMYFISIATTIIIVLAQLFMHNSSKVPHLPKEEKITFVVEDTQEAIDLILESLSEYEVEVLKISYSKLEDGLLSVTTKVSYDGTDKDKLMRLIAEIHKEEKIKSAQY
ncbi:MAG: MgtC/SapB family protein [Clostridia bacterium]|nr:MgtC/SapB family protein [Clostridia bacterium]